MWLIIDRLVVGGSGIQLQAWVSAYESGLMTTRDHSRSSVGVLSVALQLTVCISLCRCFYIQEPDIRFAVAAGVIQSPIVSRQSVSPINVGSFSARISCPAASFRSLTLLAASRHLEEERTSRSSTAGWRSRSCWRMEPNVRNELTSLLTAMPNQEFGLRGS